jgi:uncharacterized protein (TIGR02996 family)
MRRFEFQEGTSNKFWEISVEGSAFTVRYGKIGANGQTQTKTFKDAAKAEAEANKLIAEKTKKGYVEVAAADDAPATASAKPTGKTSKAPSKTDAGTAAPAPSKAGEARNPALEQAIHDDPSNRQAWSVYADWLQSVGDPWGERLSLGLAQGQAKGAEKTRLTKAIDKLEAEQRETFLGPLAKLMEAKDFGQVASLELEHGFVVGVRVGSPEYGWKGSSPDAILRALVKSPVGRFLRSITIGLIDFDYPVSMSKAIDALAKVGPLPSVRELFLGDFEYPDQQEISWVSVGDVGPLLSAMPNLRELHLRGGEIGLGKALEHDKLETLLIETGGLPAAAVKAIGKAKLPNLTRMEVWFGRDDYGGDGNIKMLAPLFTGEGVPKLRHLGLMNSEFENDIAKHLAKSPLLAQLEVVDLSMGTLHDEGGKAILAAADAFKHLKKLDLDHNYLSDDTAKALEKALRKVVSIGNIEDADEDGDETYYYTQVGE